MKISIKRKSSYSLDETLANLRKQASRYGLQVIGEAKHGNWHLVYFFQPEWFEHVTRTSLEVLPLVPSFAAVTTENGGVWVTVGNPQLTQLDRQAQEGFQAYIQESLGVGKLSVRKVRLFSTTTCPYCKMEDRWLDEQKIEHDTVLVDLDPARAQEMVSATGQMGVPVTEVVFEDDSKEYVVGFDKASLSSLLLP